MAQDGKWMRLPVAGVACSIVLILATAPTAVGQEKQDLAQLVAQVDPSVVTVALSDKSLGSGFVVDEKGLVLTNYHVIEGAKEAVVVFPDKTKFKVEGFIGILPKKDLALLRIEPGAKRLQALRVAEQPPAKGEKVYAFGAPMGLSGSVSDGIVAALRAGEDVRNTLKDLAKRDIYHEILGYDLDAQWLQTTAPISPGNSGGPLVNGKGEVVGINTWVHALGQNLNFALSAVHVKPMIAAAGTTLHPLAELPKPREHRQEAKGDAKKTLALWNQLNELKLDLAKKMATQDRKLKENTIPVGLAVRGVQGKLNKMAAARREQGKAYSAYASEIKTFELEGADPEFAIFAIAEADLAQRFAAVYQDYAAAIAANSPEGAAVGDHNLKVLGSAMTSFRTAQDVLRVNLVKRYGLKFPSFETVAKEGGKSEGKTAEKEEADAPVDRSAPRLWTDRTGNFQVRAKYLGTEEGKVKLEKADGTVISVPTERLSDEDQKFIGADKRVE
jgi:S1-C subfamily serine protease